MSCGGTSLPRRKVGVGGLAVRYAQSRGEWPGSRRTFFDGRAEGERIDVVGAIEEVGGAGEREGGPRRVDAEEGGGRRVFEGLGGVLKVGGLGVGREGGRMREVGGWSGFCFTFGLGSAGGGIIVLLECSIAFA